MCRSLVPRYQLTDSRCSVQPPSGQHVVKGFIRSPQVPLYRRLFWTRLVVAWLKHMRCGRVVAGGEETSPKKKVLSV